MASGKTELCRHWASKGRCDLGDKCRFAHGRSSLATTPTKTQLCNNFMLGSCKYGSKCHFAHSAMELNRGVIVGQDVSKTSFKTVMCKNFLAAGFCPQGFNCQFAHGAQELSRATKSGVKMLVIERNKKTEICKNWEDGKCKYGNRCDFAHGEGELKEPGAAKAEAELLKKNPLYKTTLCRSFKEDEFCELGDRCHFAHGEDELRKLDPALFDGRSGYKEVLCKNFLAGEECQYGSGCLFAHGEAELRQPGAQLSGPNAPGYKEIMCKHYMTHNECKFGKFCNFAHSESELRNNHKITPMYKTVLCKSWALRGFCQYQESCIYAHGEMDLRGEGGPGRLATQADQSSSKTVLCKNFADDGKCKWGDKCKWAHGEEEQKKAKRKEIPCKNFAEGSCKYGSTCHFKHRLNSGAAYYQAMGQSPMADYAANFSGSNNMSTFGGADGVGPFFNNRAEMQSSMMMSAIQGGNGMMENGMSMENHPQYKTLPCSTYANTGMCPYGSRCMFAHSTRELRPSASTGTKSVLCKMWLDEGECRMMGCRYAHGKKELTQAATEMYGMSSFKTQPCKNIIDEGFCPYGPSCQFAHSRAEMEKAGAAGGSAGGLASNQSASMSGSGSDPLLNGKFKVVLCSKFDKNACEKGINCHFAHGLEELDYYRTKQVPSYKKIICKPYKETGECEYGNTCMFAHGSHELRAEAGSSRMAGRLSGSSARFDPSDSAQSNKFLARPSDSLSGEFPEPKRMRF